MPKIVTRTVADMPETSRRHVEALLGESLASDQRVYIFVDELYKAKDRRKVGRRKISLPN